MFLDITVKWLGGRASQMDKWPESCHGPPRCTISQWNIKSFLTTPKHGPLLKMNPEVLFKPTYWFTRHVTQRDSIFVPSYFTLDLCLSPSLASFSFWFLTPACSQVNLLSLLHRVSSAKMKAHRGWGEEERRKFATVDLVCLCFICMVYLVFISWILNPTQSLRNFFLIAQLPIYKVGVLK